MRIAITGVGVVSPIGTRPDAFSAALRSGVSAVRPHPDLGKWVPTGPGPLLKEGFPVLAARVGDFGAREVIDAARLRRIPRQAQFCIVAARQALGPDFPHTWPYDRARTGVVLGTGLGAFDQTMEFTSGYLQGGPEAASPALFPGTVMNAAAAQVSMELDLRGPNITVNHRDLSALEAVATAREQLLLGRADAVLCGGFDELGPFTAHFFARLFPLVPAGGAMRPYDRRRHGIALGEGAAVVLLEPLEAARRRGAPLLAELAGVGRAGDERPRTLWHRAGEGYGTHGACRAVQQALAEADVAPAALDFIAGSGNGTDLDVLETLALRPALGAAAATVRIGSILGQTGESMMSGALRLLAAVHALREQSMPGTIDTTAPDPDASLPAICLVPLPGSIYTALVPAFAQGGGNVALVLKKL